MSLDTTDYSRFNKCMKCGGLFAKNVTICPQCMRRLRTSKPKSPQTKMCHACGSIIPKSRYVCPICGGEQHDVAVKHVEVARAVANDKPRKCGFCERPIKPDFMYCPYCGKRTDLYSKERHSCKECYVEDHPCGFRNEDGYCPGFVGEYDVFSKACKEATAALRSEPDNPKVQAWVNRLKDQAKLKGWEFK